MHELAVAAAVGVVAVGGLYMVYDEYSANGSLAVASKSTSLVHVVTKPEEMSDWAAHGEVVYNTRCRKCHGPLGLGSVGGPPLVSETFAKSVYPDRNIARAIFEGVPQFSYDYGPMPAQADVSPGEARAVVSFLREVQEIHGFE